MSMTVPLPGNSGWPAPVRRWDTLMAVLRIAVGSVFVIAGFKGVAPTLYGFADRDALVAKFVEPTTGFLAPWIVDRVSSLGLPVGTMLLLLGVVELGMGLALMAGLGTRMMAFGAAVMLWSFTVAAPTAGAIRLARDLALLALCVALVRAGGGRWSLDRRIANGFGLLAWRGIDTDLRPRGRLRLLADRMFGDATLPAARRDGALLLIRLGLAFPMLTSVVFIGGSGDIFDNPMNSTLPLVVVGIVGVTLAVGVLPRWVMAPVALWMGTIVIVSVATDGLFAGLDNGKREIGLLAAALVYVVAGPDRWSWPRRARVRCREASELLLSYVDGTLDSRKQHTLETHFADCPDCWRYLGTYQQTVTLGRQLREETMPADVYDRLETLVRTTLARTDASQTDR